jgi:hypothetical protein
MNPSSEVLAAGTMENCFRDASDLVESYVVEGATTGEGAAQAATMHLVCRSIADLRSAQYLATSGFTIQMYSLVRPVMESINLIELFAAEPDMADQWAAGEHWKFAPAKVRERLGVGDDPIYSWACAHSHPRFPGFQLTTYSAVDHATGRTTIHPFIGGLPLEFPVVLMAATMPGNTLCMLALALGHLTVKEEVAQTWPTVVRQVGQTVLPGYEAVYGVLEEKHGLLSDETAELLGRIRSAIEAAAEMEGIVADALAEQNADA